MLSLTSPWPLLALLAVAAVGAQEARFWVAPGGDDAGPGSAQAPFASLTRARDAARGVDGAPEIVLAAGTYELAAPLELGPEDAGVTWRAADGAEVRVLAGRPVTGWAPVTDAETLARLDPAARGQVLAADLKAQGISDYGDMSGGFGMGGSTGLELFLNDQPMWISRYPNDGFVRITEVLGETPREVRGTRGTVEGIFRYDDERLDRWADEQDPRVLGYWFWDWADQRHKVASLDPERNIIAVAPPYHGSGYRKGMWFYGFNLLSEIDQPGEWYLDRDNGILYVWPPEHTGELRAMVSLLPAAIQMADTHDVTLRGLTVEGARGHGITVADSRDVIIDGCTVRNLGSWAVRVDGGERVTVRDCEISGSGDGGISLNGGDRRTLTPAGHLAVGNHIHHYSRWNRTYRPGIAIGGVGQRVANNLIHHAPHQAMSLGGNDHVIEYNEIHSVCEESNDAGTIYGWNDWAARGHEIRYNFIHHVYGHEARGANGVYLDDAFSSANIHHNVFWQVLRPIHLGGGRDHRVANNLFVDCPRAIHIDARGLGWRAYGYDELKKKLEQWPYRQPPWSERYPELVTLLEDEPMAPKGNRVVRNIVVGGSWDDIEGKAKPFVALEDNLLEAEREVIGMTPAGPRVNRDAAAVQAIGWEPLPYEQMGLPRAVAAEPAETREWAGSPTGRPAPHPAKPVDVRPGSPTVDGRVSAGEYPGEPLLLAESPGREKLTTPSPRAWLAHRDGVLYVAVETPASAKLVSEGAWGAVDGLEVAFRRHADKPGPIFVVQGLPDGTSMVSPDPGTPAEARAKLADAVRYTAALGDGSWTAEFAIPLAAAGIAPQADLALGFNLGVRRLATDEWIAWTGTGAQNWVLDGAGRVILR